MIWRERDNIIVYYVSCVFVSYANEAQHKHCKPAKHIISAHEQRMYNDIVCIFNVLFKAKLHNDYNQSNIFQAIPKIVVQDVATESSIE